MFKFVVLSALVAVVFGAPGVLHSGLAYSGHVSPVHSVHHGLAIPAVSAYSTHGVVNAHGVHSHGAVAVAHHSVHGVHSGPVVAHGVHGVAPIAVARSVHGVHHGDHGVHHGVHVL